MPLVIYELLFVELFGVVVGDDFEVSTPVDFNGVAFLVACGHGCVRKQNHKKWARS